MNRPKVIELCCGYGGATSGMIAAGLEIEASYDIWDVAVEAHLRWHPDAPCAVRDVATIDPSELEGRIVWASLPCQPWSTANRVRRGKSHASYYSLAHFAHQVQHAHFAVLENVPGLLHERDGRNELAELERACARLGLPLSVNLIPAAWYGVPQLRRRAIIVIGRKLIALSDLQPARRPASALQAAPRATYGGGMDTLAYSKSANTNRSLRSPAENAALQGVPLEHIAHLPVTHQYTLIGNCVPPKFAEGVMRQLLGGSQ